MRDQYSINCVRELGLQGTRVSGHNHTIHPGQSLVMSLNTLTLRLEPSLKAHGHSSQAEGI